MSRDSDHPNGSDSRKSSSGMPTRRQALKTVGATTVGGTFLSGVAAGRLQSDVSSDVEEYAPDWWEAKEHGGGEDVQLVAEGVDEWVSEDYEAPDWFTIGEEDEVEYMPHGVFRTQSAELCLPTSVKVGKVTVGLEACHYGGCEWKLEACLGACVGTGMNDSCDGYYNLGVDLGVVDGSLQIFPEGEQIGYSTAIVLTELEVEGELCYYYVLDSDCKTVSHTFDFS